MIFKANLIPKSFKEIKQTIKKYVEPFFKKEVQTKISNIEKTLKSKVNIRTGKLKGSIFGEAFNNQNLLKTFVKKNQPIGQITMGWYGLFHLSKKKIKALDLIEAILKK